MTQDQSILPVNSRLPKSLKPWVPVLPANLRDRAKDALQAIMASSPSPDDPRPGPSLAVGHAGIALLYGYAYLAFPSEQHFYDLTQQHLERAVELLETTHSNPWLFTGFSGVAWTVDHLQHIGLIQEGEDFNESVDQALWDFLSTEPWRGLPELISGIAGIGLYALDRHGKGRGQEIVARVVDILFQKAEQTPHGLTWFDTPELLHPITRELYPRGLFNLGVAHGVPGVIGFLAMALSQGHAHARALLDSSISWLLSCRDPHENGSLFGTGFGRLEKPNPFGSRLTWCYGDLGIALVLLLAARLTQDSILEAEAMVMVKACATRHTPEKGIIDGCICHGAFGNAHLFCRLFQATGDEACLTRAVDFYHMGLDMRRETLEAGGFLTYRPPQPGESTREPWIALPGLLEGSTGVGLALLAATTHVEPCWDRHLFVHVAPRMV